jgi:hypothetical protein
MRELPGSRGLLISIEKPSNLPSNIEWSKVNYLDYMMYSVFIMHSLYAYIRTDYCLIVQDDSWVLNGNNFKPEYYDYDYIGGICHAGMQGGRLWLQGSWVNRPDPILVQNGGFSLRSRRFLEAPNRYGIVHNHAHDIHLWNEDVQLSCLKKHVFEAVGMRYAPDEVAKTFSLESVIPQFHDDFDFNCLLGAHSTSRKLVSDTHIVVNSDCLSSHREPEFLTFLQTIGHTVEYVARSHTKT